MSDVVRPSKEAFDSTLRESCKLWSSYLDADDSEPILPFHCVELKHILAQTPSFLAHGIIHPTNEPLSFDCVEKGTRPGSYGLYVRGKSRWETSKGLCHLEPRVIPHELLLATQNPLKVEFSDTAPFAEWPNVQGLYGNDEGNYVGVLLLAWSYILSARWAELLGLSSDHDCTVRYETQIGQPISESRYDIELEIGDDIESGEARWWNAVLAADKGWRISTDYNHKTYLSPWSVSIPDKTPVGVRKTFSDTNIEPPSSDTALKYLARFCAHHRLYGQCSAALAAALYIPLRSSRRPISLPMPRPPIKSVMQAQPFAALGLGKTTTSHLELVAEYGRLLPYYMSLSSNYWGMRSLLCSTFFNPDIECNLVSAWLNPAFAVIDPLLIEGDMPKLAALLSRRHPTLAPLWLGAIIMGRVKSDLRDIRNGLTAINLHAAAWTGTIQSFITLKPGTTDGKMIRREDECRLLFISASNGYSRAPIAPWKPFGESRLCDTELEVRQHALCECHFLEYQAWYWSLKNGEELQDPGLKLCPLDKNIFNGEKVSESSSTIRHYDYSSELLSEVETRAIFQWLRQTGYPACEKPLYQHSWIDIGSTDDDDDVDDDESDAVRSTDSRTESIEKWLQGIDCTVELSTGRDCSSRLSGRDTAQSHRTPRRGNCGIWHK